MKRASPHGLFNLVREPVEVLMQAIKHIALVFAARPNRSPIAAREVYPAKVAGSYNWREPTGNNQR